MLINKTPGHWFFPFKTPAACYVDFYFPILNPALPALSEGFNLMKFSFFSYGIFIILSWFFLTRHISMIELFASIR